MKPFANALAITGLLILGACSGPGDRAKEFYQTYTLQGIIADAVTGARIGGSDLRLSLIQGVDIRGPSRLISNAGDPLLGEYAFSGIPVDLNAGNQKYKVVAIKPGYLRFEAEIAFSASPTTTGMVDTVYNFIGNIYLFPLGSTAPSYTFTVTYNGRPVPNATIYLDPIATSYSTTHNAGSVLAATNGYLASVQTSTGTDGKATVAGSMLAVGAAYRVEVPPTTFTDLGGTTVQLARFIATTNMVAGVSNADQRIALTELRLRNLYVVNASNRPLGQIFPNGQLAITFNAAVALVTPNGFAAILNPGTNGAGTAPGSGVLSTTQPVNASLSADGLTLTLAPNYTTPPAPTDRGVSIAYNNNTTPPLAGVSPRDYPGTFFPVFGTLLFADGIVFGPPTPPDDRTVRISGP